MKKVFLLLFFITAPLLVKAQLNGDGSYGNGWNGTLTGNTTWSGTNYVNGDVIVDNEKLTINPGAKIIFLAEASDLIITGTGQLDALGTSGNMITFTADYNNNGVYGETGERWGHISFQNLTAGFTAPSVIDYCIIEFGQKNSTTFNFESSGGGIHTNYTYLTISNSIIRNNYAGWGGGILVNENSSPYILNCMISNNTAGTTAGGILLYRYSSAILENCIIVKNQCNGGGSGGGVFIGDFPGNVMFYNCTIASNSSTTYPGNNIRIWRNIPSSGPRFFNSIVWGKPSSIRYLGTVGPNVTDFNYCAIQGYTSGYTNCINLSATNNNPAGPNFYNVTSGSEDYRIHFISPCRDIGTNSHTLDHDYLGNHRIGTYDIGAYEVQYSRWTGASSDLWATQSNWEANVDPSTGTGDIIIPSGLINYPTGSTSQDFTLASGKFMTLNPGAKATFNSLITTGTLKLESDASGISSLITNNTGVTATVELYLSGKELTEIDKWHYISSPVSSLAVSTFSPSPTQDLAQYVESLPTFDNDGLKAGWIAYDGYNYSLRSIPVPALYTFSTLSIGQGYNYFHTANHKYTFSGILNTADVNKGLGYSGIPSLHGFNLLGNPFSSGLDWNQIISDPSYPANTSKGVYFTRDNTQCAYVGGVGIPVDVTGIIPPMQGFFTKTAGPGNSIKLLSSARVQNNIHPRYKGESAIPLIRLSLTENQISDETVVRFDALAKSSFDYDFDAVKMFISSTGPSIYSSLNGTKFAINGLPFPETFVEIPIVVKIVSSGNHSINATQVQGLGNYPVTLTDKSTGFTADLKTTPTLTFSASPGLLTDRFILKVGNITTGTEVPVNEDGTFNIYPSFGSVNIQTVADEWNGKSGSVKILDLSGRLLRNLDNANFSKTSIISVPVSLVKGIYFVEIRSGVNRFVGKVVIK